ncbi:hypothetical protein GCM10009716_36460 [Streptomyces sodiiphilus]|uniref:Tryptophan synthase subunit(Beta) n=1 Tax=Streptomyces sodiiphilus TaxID=226217 RepID=A0ABN2PLH8_9ACTN
MGAAPFRSFPGPPAAGRRREIFRPRRRQRSWAFRIPSAPSGPPRGPAAVRPPGLRAPVLTAPEAHREAHRARGGVRCGPCGCLRLVTTGHRLRYSVLFRRARPGGADHLP